jgi:hypothetical protein
MPAFVAATLLAMRLTNGGPKRMGTRPRPAGADSGEILSGSVVAGDEIADVHP